MWRRKRKMKNHISRRRKVTLVVTKLVSFMRRYIDIDISTIATQVIITYNSFLSFFLPETVEGNLKQADDLYIYIL